MATAGIYYIDTFNFADATAVYTDAALTTFAPDGYYQMGGVTARQQVGGILLPAEPCPSCAKPSPDPTPNPNNAFKVTDKVTSVIDHVVLDNNFSVGEEVTTDISSNCWLINEKAVNSTTNVITGKCAVIPPPPAEYYELDLCPISANTGVPTKIYSSLTPTSGQRLYVVNIYNNAYYLYNNAQPVTTPVPGIPLIETGISLTAASACPTVPTLYTYWNAQECNNPNITKIIQAPDGTSFVVGQSVKISNTCYEITSQRVGSATTFDIQYLAGGTVYTGCTTGASPCIVTVIENSSFLARENTTNAEYHVLMNSSFKVNDNVEIQTSGGVQIAGCYKLVSQSTTPTTNTIINFCPDVSACATYRVIGSGTFNRCSDGQSVFRDYSSDPSGEVCARLDTANFSGGATQIGTCINDIPFEPTGFDYYTAEPCDGGAEIIVRTDGAVPATGSAVKLDGGSTCYKITGTSGLKTATNNITNRSDSCNVCNPPATCFAHQVEYNSSTNVCPTGGYGVTFADTNDFSTATKLYSSDGCVSSQPALDGTYAVTTSGTKISRYWNGVTLGTATVCSSTPQNVTATITTITNNIQGSTEGVGYTITGSGTNSSTTGASPLAIPSGGNSPFNTAISVNPGFTITGDSVTYSPTSITQSSSVTVTLEGTITEDAPTNVYFVLSCGNLLYYRVESPSALSSGTVIYFRSTAGQVLCGTVQSTDLGAKNADLIQIITSQGCNNSLCTQGSFNPLF